MSNTDRWIIPFMIDLENGAPQRRRPPQGIMLPGDNRAHTIQVTAYAGREPAALSGTPRGYFIREADGATVICTGSRSGNVASVTMAQACYAYPGPLRCVIRLENSGNPDVTLVDTTFYVEPGTGENIIDPGTPIHNVTELLEHLEDMEEATANARGAVSYIAQAYSTSAIYTEGEYAIHDGRLYRCTATMESAETWTPAHWTQVNFGAELYAMDTSMHHHDLLFPRNGGRVAVAPATSGAITVTVPRYLVRVRDRAAVNIDLGAADNAYTVPDGSALILTGDNTLAVGTLNANLLDNNGNCILLYNDRGVPCGQWGVAGKADKAEVNDLKSALVSVNIPNLKLFLDFKVGAVSSSGIVANTKRIYSGVFYSGTGKHIRVAVVGNCRYTCPWYDNADGTGYHSGGNWKAAGEEFELVDNRYYRIYIANALTDADETEVSSAYSSYQYKNLIVYQDVDGIAEKNTVDYVTPYYLNYGRYFGAYLIQGGAYFSIGSDITIVINNNNRVVSNVIHLDNKKQYIVRGNGDFTRYLYNYGDANDAVTYNSSWISGNNFTLTIPMNAASSIRFCFNKQVESEEVPLSINDLSLIVEPLTNDESYIPLHWETELNNIVSSLNTRAALLGNGITFAFLTDDHMEQNNGNSPKLLQYIQQHTECKSILLGGDYIVDGTTESEVVSKVMTQLSKYQDVFGVNVYPVAGNHDFGVDVRIPYTTIQRLVTTIPRMNPKCKTVSNWYVDKDYYVVYDDASNTYLLCLWSASGQAIQNDLAYAISFFDMLPEDANVIVLTHIIWDTQEVITERAQVLLNVLDAVKTKTTYSNSTYNINVDYTGSTTNIVCVLCGHIHKDKYIVTTGGIPIISTKSDAYKTSAVGTTEEQAFDVVQVDYDNSKIYMTRVGSGDNRTFDF